MNCVRFIALLCLAGSASAGIMLGCSETPLPTGSEGGDQAGSTPEVPRQGEGDAFAIPLVTGVAESEARPMPNDPPTRDGYEWVYESGAFAFNVHGRERLHPFTVDRWRTYHLGRDWRAIAVYDERSRVSIIVAVDLFAYTRQAEDGRLEFAINPRENSGRGWLIQHESDSGIEGVWEDLLAHAAEVRGERSDVLPMRGRISMVIDGEVIQSIGLLGQLQTIDPMPRDEARIREEIDEYKARIESIDNAEDDDDAPGDDWDRRHARNRIEHLKELLDGAPQPAHLADGVITGMWVRPIGE